MKLFYLTAFLFLLPLTYFAGEQVSSPAYFYPEPATGPDQSPASMQQPDAGELPLQIFETAAQPALPMLVYISGDGGWNNFSSSLCRYLNQKGVPVVALDAQKYFWKGRSPDETAKELASVIEKYLREWKRKDFVLAGFSFGADVTPFIVNRLPDQVCAALSSSVLISPDRNCDFEIHLADMLSLGISKGKYDVVAEISGSHFRKFAVLFGSDESIQTQSAFRITSAKILVLPGSHHFDSAFESVGNSILSEMR